MHPSVVARAVGAVIGAGGAAMLVPMLYSLLTGDGNVMAFAVPASGALLFGAAMFFFARVQRSPYVSGRDVYLIVVLGWLAVATVGCVPFVLSGLLGPSHAFFESMAGFTTTGASSVRYRRRSRRRCCSGAAWSSGGRNRHLAHLRGRPQGRDPVAEGAVFSSVAGL